MTRILPLTLAVATSVVALDATFLRPVLAQTATSDVSVPEGYQVIQGNVWSFAVPSDWQTTQFPVPASGPATLEAQLSDNQGQIFLNLVTEPFIGDSSTYIEFNLENMSAVGFAVHNHRSVEIGLLNGEEVESTLPSDPPVRMLQRITVGSNQGFALTCGSLEANFETVRATCSSILETFQVVP